MKFEKFIKDNKIILIIVSLVILISLGPSFNTQSAVSDDCNYPGCGMDGSGPSVFETKDYSLLGFDVSLKQILVGVAIIVLIVVGLVIFGKR